MELGYLFFSHTHIIYKLLIHHLVCPKYLKDNREIKHAIPTQTINITKIQQQNYILSCIIFKIIQHSKSDRTNSLKMPGIKSEAILMQDKLLSSNVRFLPQFVIKNMCAKKKALYYTI